MAKKVYPTCSSKAIIAKVIRDFRPNYESWIMDAYEWIGEAVGMIGTIGGVDVFYQYLSVMNGRAKVPCNFVEMKSIFYNGKRLQKSISDSDCSGDYYFPGEGYFRFSFEEGTARLKYKGFVIEKDGSIIIPDTPEYKQALSFYILRQMISGGYQHPIFDWQAADQLWSRYGDQAANDMRYPSVDDAERTMRWWTDSIPGSMSWHGEFGDFNEIPR